MAREEEPDPLAPLIEDARNGDERALGRLLRALWPWLRKKAGHLAGRSANSLGGSSLAQESALRLSRSIRGARAADSPAVKALLTRIMENTAESSRRSAARLKRRAVPLSAEDFMTLPVRSDVALEQREQEQRVHAAIEQLPDHQRQAVQMLCAHATYQDIAAALGRSVGAVHMLLQRARAQLAEALHEHDGPESRDRGR